MTKTRTARRPQPSETEIPAAGRPSDSGPDLKSNTLLHSSTGEATPQEWSHDQINPAYESALLLARDFHLRVYPVHRWRDGRCSCKAAECCEEGGKHPIHTNWQNAASSDLDQLAWWHQANPDANWGVLADAFVIIDLDGIKPAPGQPGKSPRECIPDEALWERAGMIIQTGGGGYQMAFANPPDKSYGPKPRNWVRPLPGLDTRGTGGGTILPGSTSYKGTYRWEREPIDGAGWRPLPAKIAYDLKRGQQLNLDRISKSARSREPIPLGERDSTMFRLIVDLWNGGLDPEELLRTAMAVNRDRCRPPLPGSVIYNKWERIIQQPRQPRLGACKEDLGRYQEPVFLLDTEGIKYTDLGNARRLALNWSDQLCFIDQWGWHYYRNGKYWRDTMDLQVAHLAKQTIELAAAWSNLPEQVMRFEGDPDALEKYREAWYRNVKNASNRVPQIIALAKSEPTLHAPAETFDADPWALNTPEGILDLRHPDRPPLPHTPQQRNCRQTGAHYDADAKCEQWLKFLNSTFEGKQRVIDFMQLLLGYALTGDMNEQVWILLVGRTGRNGKGTLIEVFRRVLGDYVTSIPIEALLASGHKSDGNGPQPALVPLVGARMATAQEPQGGFKEEARWNVSRLNELTGQDMLSIRDMYGKSFLFTNGAKLFVSVNHVPEMNWNLSATRDRIIPIEFPHYFGDEERNNQLREILFTEVDGILQWALAGLKRYLVEIVARRKRLIDADVQPEEIRREKQGQQERDDEYAVFFREVLVYDADPKAYEKLKDVWAAWETWYTAIAAQDKHSAPPPLYDSRQLAKLCESRGMVKRRTRENLAAIFKCRLIDPHQPPPPQPPPSGGRSSPSMQDGDDGDDGEAAGGDGPDGRLHTKSCKGPLDPPRAEDLTDFDVQTSITSITIPVPDPSDVSGTRRTLVTTLVDLRSAVDMLLARAPVVPVCLDVETTGLNPETDRIVLLQLHQEDGPTYIVDWRKSDVSWQSELLRLLRGVKVVGHNIGFDISMLIGQEGVTWRDVVVTHDTMLSEQVIHGSRRTVHDTSSGLPMPKGYALDEVAQSYGIGGIVKGELQQAWRAIVPGSLEWTRPFTPAEIEYAARDVEVLPALMCAQQRQLALTEQEDVAALEHSIVPMMADMRAQGVYIDRELWAEVVSEGGPRLAQATQTLRELLDDPDGLINLNSPKQLLHALQTHGLPMIADTKAETLERLADTSPLARAVRDYRDLEKARSSFGVTWLEQHVTPSGRVHASWHQIGAETGRMACSQPSLQNIPSARTSRHREAFTAPDGCTLLTADYSNAELRIAAALSGDRAMQAAFGAGLDLHAETARAIFELDPDVTVKAQGSFAPGKSYRDAAKQVNLGLQYGMGATGLSRKLNVSKERAEEILARHRSLYPTLMQWFARNRDVALERGFAVTRLGRRRFFEVPPKPDRYLQRPEWEQYQKDTGWKRGQVGREGMNHPIQGGCATIFKTTVRLLAETLDPARAHIVLLVHDEVVLEVTDDYADEAERLLQRAMVGAFESYGVPLPEPKVTRSHYWMKAD